MNFNEKIEFILDVFINFFKIFLCIYLALKSGSFLYVSFFEYWFLYLAITISIMSLGSEAIKELTKLFSSIEPKKSNKVSE